MYFMKLLVVVFSLLLVTSGLAWGVRGPSKVSAGYHNLSSDTGGFYETNVDAICVFCHTPHGGSLDGPLWNRGDATSVEWKHYNSATLSTHLKGLPSNRAPNPISMLCLSCHDGSLALNHVLNEPNVLAGAPITGAGGTNPLYMVTMFGQNPSIIGSTPADEAATGDFTDDHPFSFSYDAVLASTEYQSGNAKYNSLKLPGIAVGLGVQFFASPDATGPNHVECSSCHDPHVDYSLTGDSDYAPFLITPNTGSLLCLACHTK
jgi:hypothetical protein